MELLVLNTAFESIAVVDTYESLIWTDRYNAYGDFEIFFAMDTGLLEYLKEDNYLWLKESEHCMIIEEIKIDSDTEDGQLPENEYIAQLTAKGEKNLADHDRVTAFEGEVEVTRLFKYGEDFFIGDIVQIANEYGNEGSAYISELIISRSKDEQSIYPTFKTISEKEGTS